MRIQEGRIVRRKSDYLKKTTDPVNDQLENSVPL